MDLEKIRLDFPITEKAIYLNHAAIGPSPTPVIEESKKWLIHNKTYGELFFPSLAELLEEQNIHRKTIGEFINARFPEQEIAFTYNTSYGLSAIAEGIQWEKGQQIILNNLEYTSNSYTYQALARKFELDIVVIQNKDGILPLIDYEAKASSQTRLIAVSHVQFSNGFRSDLGSLAKIAHENEGELIVDCIQSLGAIPLDVQKEQVDYLAAGGYKWMLGQLGTGFLYVKKELAERLNPSFIGSMSDTSALNLSHHDYNPAQGAKRFQASLGPHSNLMGKAVEYLLSVGKMNIFKRILNLTDLLIDLVEDEPKFNLKSPIDNISQRSGIINFTCPNAEEIVAKLRTLPQPIAVSFREGGIRVSPHFYNTESEIETAFYKIKDFTKNI